MKRMVMCGIAALVLFAGGIAVGPGGAAAAKPTPTPQSSGAATKTPTPAKAETGPLAARIGGSKASFNAKYGPAETGATTKANTAIYKVKGYGQIAIIFNGNEVVAISAIADRGGTSSLTTPSDKDWSVATATRHAKSFLPDDATYSAKPITTSGKVSGDCHSAALATAIGGAVMTKLGAKGAAGDCSYILTQDTKGDVSAFTVAIGSTGATSQVVAPSSAPTPPPKVPTQAAAKPTKSASGGASNGTVTKHCADFTTQAAAQAYFESVGGDNSPQGRALDADHDGKACESLK